MSEWLPTHADLSSSLLNQSIRNPKGKSVANKDRKSAADSSNDSLAPSAVSQGSRKQCQDERNPELAENDVPRRKRNHAATVVLPPMNSSRHLLVEGNIDCAKQSDYEQPNLAKPFPQSQSDVSELHCHNFPGQWHPERGSPDQWPAANRVIQRAGVIDQPRIGRKLAKSDYDSKKKESTKQCIAPNECKANKKTIIDNVERRTSAPVRPWRKRQYRNPSDVDDYRRDYDTQTLAFQSGFGEHDVDLARPVMLVNCAALSIL